MLVKTLMTTRPAVIRPEQTLEDARIMLDQEGLHDLPVVADAALVGMVSSEDLLRAAPSIFDSAATGDRLTQVAGAPVSAVMHPAPVTIAPDESIEQASALLLKHDLNALPVVQENRLVGMLTRSDLLRSINRLMDATRPGLRVELKLGPEPEQFHRLVDLCRDSGVEIAAIAICADARDEYRLITLKIRGFEHGGFIDSLWDEGFTVNHILRVTGSDG